MNFIKLVAKHDIFNNTIKIFSSNQSYIAKKINDRYIINQDLISETTGFQLFDFEFILENFNIIDNLI